MKSYMTVDAEEAIICHDSSWIFNEKSHFNNHKKKNNEETEKIYKGKRQLDQQYI